MNVIFISYWGINDGLTQATVLPNIKTLAEFDEVNTIFLFTIERSHFSALPSFGKIIHIPMQSKNYKNVFLNKLSDFVQFTSQVTDVVEKNKIALIICRSSLAGSIGHLVSKKTNVPYVVESFEPHAEYMLESNVWKKYDPRYWIETYFQRLQQKKARYILPVSNNYARQLINSGVSEERIITMPCSIDFKTFYRDPNSKRRIQLSIADDATVGIYVGKFGGMYYDDEAFKIFAVARNVFVNFFLLILTPDDREQTRARALRHGFNENEFTVIAAPHQDVPSYLSIADFAFATYKPSPSKRFLSPIKVGEYWACGLPVLLTRGVGDDASIIENSKCGATFELANVSSALRDIEKQLRSHNVRENNLALALENRDEKIMKAAYVKVIQSSCKR